MYRKVWFFPAKPMQKSPNSVLLTLFPCALHTALTRDHSASGGTADLCVTNMRLSCSGLHQFGHCYWLSRRAFSPHILLVSRCGFHLMFSVDLLLQIWNCLNMWGLDVFTKGLLVNRKSIINSLYSYLNYLRFKLCTYDTWLCIIRIIMKQRFCFH